VFSAQASIPFAVFFNLRFRWDGFLALYYYKLFGVYPICSALNLIVSIESAKSINYQLVKQYHKKREFLFLKAYFPKPAHRLPEKLQQGFFPSRCT
jgi:hypothetical protein